MRSTFLLTLTTLLPVALSNPEWATNPPTLNASLPIYLATVFFPPQMHFAAWVPPPSHELHTTSELDWCKTALDVSDSLHSGARTPPFTIEGMDGLKVHDFFADQAYISRHGVKFANCYVTPQSGAIGFCEGRKSEGEKFLGTAHRVWSCFVIGRPSQKDVLGPREDNEEKSWTSTAEDEKVGQTKIATGPSITGAFTAAVTAAS